MAFWALCERSGLPLSHASCISELQEHIISGFRLLPSQSVAVHDAALPNRCVTASEKKPLDASCKYLTAVNVIAYKVIFKCSFKHPHNGFGSLLADHVTPPE